jgi:hypothetical protein
MGRDWVSSAVEVWADNAASYAPLVPILDGDDPLDELDAGRVPALHELRLHNGTIWRWNRPVYDVQHAHPHLRIENRVLPSGPTAIDMTANVALFLGLVRWVVELTTPVSAALPFRQVAADLHRAARQGLAATLHDPTGVLPGRRRAPELLMSVLPLAAAGLVAWGVDPGDAAYYLQVIEERVRAGQLGADWQTAVVAALQGDGMDRESALREMTRRYAENAGTGHPVHQWPVTGLARPGPVA